jgi:hypothetical protein
MKSQKHYGPDLLRELRKNWGAKRFDISKWRSELGCMESVSYYVEAGGQRRMICRQEKLMRRVAELSSTIQVVMQGP